MAEKTQNDKATSDQVKTRATEVQAPVPERPVGRSPDPIDKVREKNRKVLERMKENAPEFLSWFKRLDRFGVNLVDGAALSERARGGYKVLLFTEQYYHSIVVRPGDPKDDSAKGYLGCQAGTRKPLAGEDWNRGRDLSDGPYSEETWLEIVHDILAFELVRLGK